LQLCAGVNPGSMAMPDLLSPSDRQIAQQLMDSSRDMDMRQERTATAMVEGPLDVPWVSSALFLPLCVADHMVLQLAGICPRYSRYALLHDQSGPILKPALANNATSLSPTYAITWIDKFKTGMRLQVFPPKPANHTTLHS